MASAGVRVGPHFLITNYELRFWNYELGIWAIANWDFCVASLELRIASGARQCVKIIDVWRLQRAVCATVCGPGCCGGGGIALPNGLFGRAKRAVWQPQTGRLAGRNGTCRFSGWVVVRIFQRPAAVWGRPQRREAKKSFMSRAHSSPSTPAVTAHLGCMARGASRLKPRLASGAP